MRLNQAEIDRVKQQLGIVRSLDISFVSPSSDRYMRTSSSAKAYTEALSKPDGSIIIRVSDSLTLEQANVSLIHEMTHASQKELIKHMFHAEDNLDADYKAAEAYTLANKMNGYWNNPFESSARTKAAYFAEKYKVVSP